VPMGIGTDFRDKEIVETEVAVQLSSNSKTIWSKTTVVLRVVPTTSTSSTRSFSSTRIDENNAGRSTSAACADIGACVVEEHRLVRQGSAWKCWVEWRRYTNNMLRGGRTR